MKIANIISDYTETKETYNVPQANPDSPKNMLLFKKPQFLSNHYETLSK